MKRMATIVVLAALAACGGSGAPDQGTVRTCFNTIGVATPDSATLGSVQGWINVAEQAIKEAKNEQVRTAGEALRAALSPEVQQGGFSEEEVDRYAKATAQMQKACEDSKAFEGNPRL